MKSYNEEILNKAISKAINEKNYFWFGCVIGMQYGSLHSIRVDGDEELSYCVDTEEERENTFKPIVLVKYGSPYKDREPKGHIVKWYAENKEPVDVSYLRNKPEEVIYETGAKQHHINSLILFTDNTGGLVDLRDSIYKTYGKEVVSKPELFIPLCEAARHMYLREVEYDNSPSSEYFKINKMQYKKYHNDVMEFCQLYANRYNDWKLSR